MPTTVNTSARRLDWPLMRNNITRADLDALIAYLQQDEPMLTQGRQVQAFEQDWAEWLGVKYSVFVNSGSSANLLTMAAIRELYGPGEIIVPSLTWVSDIASVIQAGFTPVFVDINPRTLGMDIDQVIRRLGPRIKAVFLTHVLGYNALTAQLLAELKARNILLIEDVCESYGATFQARKLGAWGHAANFSFYYAHHMSTIEGGMVTTDDPDFYQAVRMLRSHGMVRESTSPELKQSFWDRYPDLNPDFIFAFPSYNVRSTELNAVLGRAQLRRLDQNNAIRTRNLHLFLDHLDPVKFRTDFATEGSCNYALTLILRHADADLNRQVAHTMKQAGVEYRRGTAGGGNQLRQPYLRRLLGDQAYQEYPAVDHVHFYGYYLGNYPELEAGKIPELCAMLNCLTGATGEAEQRPVE